MPASENPNSVRIGLIGAGFIAQVAHLHAFSKIAQARVVMLAEPHAGLRELVSARFKIGNTTADYMELLDRSDIDGVVICAPRRAQSHFVKDALSTSRAVLSEKPMAMTLETASELVELAGRNNALWMVGYMKRHDAGVQRFARLLADLRASGEMGSILHVQMRDFCATYGVAVPDHIRRDGPRPVRYKEAPIAPAFVPEELRSQYDYTINVASHDINLLRLLFAEGFAPLSFSIRPHGVQHAIFDASEFLMDLVVGPCDLGRWDQRLDVTFAKGRASLILPSPMSREQNAVIEVESPDRRESSTKSNKEEKRVGAFEAQARAFVEMIRSGIKSPLCSGDDAVTDVMLIDQMWRMVAVR